MEPFRINKYLASAGVAARRKVDEMIVAGKVTVNEKVAVLGMKVDPDHDLIKVDGRLITDGTEESHPSFAEATEGKEGTGRIYIVLNKPRGVVSTVQDTHGRRTVVDLVGSKVRLYPVGRLDFESEGLMILTNDGELTQRLTHPRYHVPKTYIVSLVGGLGEDKIRLMRSGVRLTDGMTAPAVVEVISKTRGRTILRITLREGRNRQIRRMVEKLHLHVVKLQRVEIGPIALGELKSGSFRGLTPNEIGNLKRAAGIL